MSRELLRMQPQNGSEISLVAFYGGHKRGPMIQITHHFGMPGEHTWVQLDVEQVRLINEQLTKWLRRHDNGS